MKSLLLIGLTLLALLSPAHTQNTPQPMVYEPFTQQELSEVNSAYKPKQIIIQTEPVPAPNDHHHKKRHDKRPRPEEIQMMEETDFESDLTQQQRQERRMQRIRYNKVFRWGMIVGTAVLAIVICKTCVAKRRRTCAILRQRREQQQIQMQEQMHMQQPYVYNLGAHTYPLNQPVQMARPYYPEPQVLRPACPPRQPEQYIVRGRPHESFLKEQTQTVEEQIRYHENVIISLKEQKRREQAESRRKMMPIHTSESIEPIRRNRQIPVGQPVYERDANSSFASEYPEI